MPTVIDATTRFKGTLHTEEDLVVCGVIEGAVHSTATVTVAPGGLIQGPVSGRVVLVQGALEGDVHAREQFLLGSAGKVEGDVKAAHIKVEDGGTLRGKVLTENAGNFKTGERD